MCIGVFRDIARTHTRTHIAIGYVESNLVLLQTVVGSPVDVVDIITAANSLSGLGCDVNCFIDR